jgi:uncharacterized protein YggT (Ycf19 family)
VIVLRYLLQAAKALIVVDAILSWVMPPGQMPRAFTKGLLDPVYAPLRGLLSPARLPIDLAPLLLLGLVFALEFSLFHRKKLPEELR